MAPPESRALCPVIAGPTAVGKTALVVGLAARFPIEIVSLDSRQIYRGLRIGTAQPTGDELAACPHHLVDFLPPERRYSARRFRDDFVRTAREIRARGSVPVLVGGAGLYLKAVAEGFVPLPGDASDLARVRSAIAALDDDAARERLREVDPESWRRIPPADLYRTRRALEIQALAGVPRGDLARDQLPDPALGLDFPLIVLDRPRAELRMRIARRTDAMLAAGWLDETAALLERHAPDCPGLRTLGYRELVAHLRGEVALDDAVARVVQRTGQYAKRQQTWFRPLPRVATGAPDDPALVGTVETLLARSCGES